MHSLAIMVRAIVALERAKAGGLTQDVAVATTLKPIIGTLESVDARLSAYLLDTVPNGEAWDDHPIDAARAELRLAIEALTIPLPAGMKLP